MTKVLIAVATVATTVAFVVSGVASAAPQSSSDQAVERVDPRNAAPAIKDAVDADERFKLYLPPDYEIQQQRKYQRMV